MSLFAELFAYTNQASLDIAKTKLSDLITIATDAGLSCDTELAYVKSLISDAEFRRIAMPVIDPDDLQKLIANQCSIGVETCILDTLDLIPLQKNLYLNKAIDCLADMPKDNRIIISKDNCIIDGHHRWLACVLGKTPQVECLRLSGTVDDIMPKLQQLSDDLGNIRKS